MKFLLSFLTFWLAAVLILGAFIAIFPDMADFVFGTLGVAFTGAVTTVDVLRSLPGLVRDHPYISSAALGCIYLVLAALWAGPNG